MDERNKPGEERDPLTELLSNPKVMAALSGIAQSLKTQTAEPIGESETTIGLAQQSDPPSSALTPDIMEKLPGVMAALSPMLSSGGSEKRSSDKKTALLNALRPYLSAGRCEAIDYIARLEKLGDVVKNML